MTQLDDMRVFAQLAAVGSFTGAARELGLTKQTVSRRVALLEDALGVQLVRRTTRRVALTEVGRAYAARCQDVVRLADEANRLATSRIREVSGRLRVTADPTLGARLLTVVVPRFASAHPAVEVDVRLTSRKVDLLDEGFDVALRVGAPPDVQHIASRRLAPARLVTVASPAYLAHHEPLREIDDLAAHVCLASLPDLGRSAWPFDVDGTIRMVQVASRIRANDVGVVHSACLDGLGVAHLPSFVVLDDIVAGRLVRLLEHRAPDVGGIHVLHAVAEVLAPKVAAFVDLAVEIAGPRLGELP